MFGRNGAIAIESKIGYLLSGPFSPSQTEVDSVDVPHVGVVAVDRAKLAQFWDVEFTGTLPLLVTTYFGKVIHTTFLAAQIKLEWGTNLKTDCSIALHCCQFDAVIKISN